MYNQTVVIDSEPEIADDGNLSQAAADEVIS